MYVYMYVYSCMYSCFYAYIMCMYAYIFIFSALQHTHTYIYIYVCVCVCVCCKALKLCVVFGDDLHFKLVLFVLSGFYLNPLPANVENMASSE